LKGVANRRTSLQARKQQDVKGVDVVFNQPAPAEEKKSLAKVTMYVRPEQIEAVEEIQFKERKRTGKKPDKSDLFQEALDLLIEKYNGQK
jgi:hypothetical protein